MNDQNELYSHWLSQRIKPCAEIVRGVQAHPLAAMRLDRAGLSAAGFSGELPISFVPDRLMAGGYDEDRAIYDSPAFADPDSEPRTVHLALDIFAPAGTEVFAPLEGRIHSFQDNAAAQDYGPTLILEHAVTADLTFWMLYGHLSRHSLEGWRDGQVFSAGERLGWLGHPQENGGWAPHLHVQVILDIGAYRGDYPGVFRRSERTERRPLCPDPAPLLGIRLET